MPCPSKLVTNERKKNPVSLSSQSLQLCLFRYTFSCSKRKKIIRRSFILWSKLFRRKSLLAIVCTIYCVQFNDTWFVVFVIRVSNNQNIKWNGWMAKTQNTENKRNKTNRKNAFLFCISFVVWPDVEGLYEIAMQYHHSTFHSLTCQISCHWHNFHFYTSVKHAWNVCCMNVM